MTESKFDKFAPITTGYVDVQETPEGNIQTTDDETKGILQGNSYAEKLRELETMLDQAPRKFKRKYRNVEGSFAARMQRAAQNHMNTPKYKEIQ